MVRELKPECPQRNWWPLDEPFDFSTAHTADECRELLQNKAEEVTEEVLFFRPIELSYQLAISNSEQGWFVLRWKRRQIGRGFLARPSAEIVGKLEQNSDGSTRIVGKGRMFRFSVAFNIYSIIALTFFAWVLRPIWVIWVFFALGIPWLLYDLYFQSISRNNLVQIIYELLQ